MKKFGLAAIVASGLTAGILGVASPILATASAEALPVVELPSYSTGVDHHQWIDTIHPNVTVPQVDTTVQQSR
ncbi:hypothetical protein [Mycolicibacterium sp. 050158]|jgi:hypothetical protein|uniref:hypothetical protein n=1 Tax=Mycolicibacterium sp. 050158 TaxID=3090602 RepID=UPI00299DFD83|nr:hypothetical protein [Mycolicibacterium sp. 050158]MDX1891259.1 hypothetical protein [Mycolicibacterium sp. 050158]